MVTVTPFLAAAPAPNKGKGRKTSYDDLLNHDVVSSIILVANYGFFLSEYRLLEPGNLFNAVAMHAP